MNKKFLFLYPPLREKPDLFLPQGCLVLSDIVKKNGYVPELLNIDEFRYNDLQIIEFIKKIKPCIIGWSAVTSTSYNYIKRINQKIREIYGNEILIILGGNLCSSAELLIKKSNVDIVFVGASEKSLSQFLKVYDGSFDNYKFENIKGIIFLKHDNLIFTGMAEYDDTLDSASLIKNFSLIDMDFYAPKIKEGANMFYRDDRFKNLLETDKKMINIMLIRGCQNHCTFCHRNISKIQKRTVDECIEYICFLRDTYNIYFFRFNSESFITKKEWILEFADKIKYLNIIFDITGVRVDCIDEEIISSLKAAGLISIDFGYETASQKMLNVMAKNVKVSDNLKAAELVNKYDILSIPQFVIGMPGENRLTLNETLRFIEKIKQTVISVNYAQALPGTPLYHYAVKYSLIEDEEKYLESISDKNAADYKSVLNFTNYNFFILKYYYQKMNFIAAYSKRNILFRLLIEFFFDLKTVKKIIWGIGTVKQKFLEIFMLITNFSFKTNYKLEYDENSKNLRKFMKSVAQPNSEIDKLKFGVL